MAFLIVVTQAASELVICLRKVPDSIFKYTDNVLLVSLLRKE